MALCRIIYKYFGFNPTDFPLNCMLEIHLPSFLISILFEIHKYINSEFNYNE
jgi:hypothetical protein